MTNDDDVVMLMAKMAFKTYEEGNITKEELLNILKRCVNCRAAENGYAERFGLPFPRV